MLLGVLPVEEVAEVELREIERFTAGALPFAVRRQPPMPLPPGAFDPRRNQYDGTVMLRAALDHCPPDATRLLVVTGHDIFIPMLTFIFGQAQLDGTAAILSLARLRPEFHGLPPRPALFAERVRKETLHELGHTFGLVHCSDRSCAMSLSINIAQIDLKREQLCRVCSVRLGEKLEILRRDNGAGEEQS